MNTDKKPSGSRSEPTTKRGKFTIEAKTDTLRERTYESLNDTSYSTNQGSKIKYKTPTKGKKKLPKYNYRI